MSVSDGTLMYTHKKDILPISSDFESHLPAKLVGLSGA